MDATQKKKLLAVTLVHFAFTIFAFCKIFTLLGMLGPHESPWHRYWLTLVYMLQPLFLIIPKVAFFLAPVWSFFFGWIFVKLDNWLNHFPVLGRKVF